MGKGKTKDTSILRHTPLLLTLGNLIMGFLAVLSVIKGAYLVSGLYILFALLFDLLDGTVARAFGWTSDIGVELDSLADSVSFVMYPAMLVYYYYFGQSTWGVVIAAWVLICGIYRLAKFNVTTGAKHFIGMPTPLFTIVVFLLYLGNLDLCCDVLRIPVFFLLAYLMVSEVPFPAFKKDNTWVKKRGGILVAVLLALFVPYMAGMTKLMTTVVVEHAIIWLAGIIPLFFVKAVRHKGYIAFLAALLLVSYPFLYVYDQPLLMAVLPALLGIVGAPLVHFAMEGAKG